MDVLARRALPLIGISSLTLGGSCSDDGLSVARIAQNACAWQLECGYDFDYESVDECVSYLQPDLESDLDYYRDEYYPAGCADAALDYFQCLGRQYGRLVCDPFPACPIEYREFIRICES